MYFMSKSFALDQVRAIFRGFLLMFSDALNFIATESFLHTKCEVKI